MLIYEHPELKPMIRRIRRNPTLDNVLKIARVVLGDEVKELVQLFKHPYPYKYSFEEEFFK